MFFLALFRYFWHHQCPAPFTMRGWLILLSSHFVSLKAKTSAGTSRLDCLLISSWTFVVRKISRACEAIASA